MTHGVLAMVILPILLTGIMLAFDRFIRLKKHPHKKPAKPIALLALAYLGTLSHPFLDWLNTYGVRLLMPFDTSWFYGDTLFIIDPWVWLLMGASVVYAYSKKRFCKLSWFILGVCTSLLISLAPMVPAAAKLTWWLGVGALITWRVRNKDRRLNRYLAGTCFAMLAIYLFSMSLINLKTKQIAEDWLENQSPSSDIISLMTGPVPANPFYRELIFKTETKYFGIGVSILEPRKIVFLFDPIIIKPPNAIVQKALSNEDIKGFVNWMRFPVYEVNQIDKSSYEVLIRDLRYVRPDQTEDIGIGFTKTLVTMNEK